MSTCKLINAPKTGEKIQSRLFEDLKSFDKKNAEEYYNETISDNYVEKYGDWTDSETGGFIFDTDTNGEPLFSKQFINSFENFELPKAALKENLIKFINGMGFQYNEVESILTGGLKSVSAVTDFLIQTVNVVHGADVKTLAEEAAHVYVEWLDQSGSHLYKSLYNDITKFKAYREVVEQYGEEYQGSEEMLRKEAMGKVLADVIIKGKSELDIDNRVKGWWGRVKEFLKGVIGVTPKQLQDYLQIADTITSGNMTGVLNKSDYRLYDINEPRILRAIQTLDDNSKKVSSKVNSDGFVEYEINGKKVENTVEQLLMKELGKRYDNATLQAKQATFLLNKEVNKVGINDINNIVERFVQKQNGQPLSSPTNNLKSNSALHNALTGQVESMLNSFGNNSKIYTNVNLYNKTRDISTTVNLMVVDETGTVHILDFRFLEDKATTEQKTLWSKEMNEAKAMLESYGFNKFGKMRNIPIETQLKNNKIIGIKLNNNNLIQNSIPISNERTNNSNLNSLLDKLQSDMTKLNNMGVKSEGEKIDRNLLINQIQKAINEIQIYENVNEFYWLSNKKLDKLEKDFASGVLDVKQLNSTLKELEYLSSMMFLEEFDLDQNGKKQNRIPSLVIRANRLQSIAKNKLYEEFKTKGIDLVDGTLTPTGFLDKVAVLGVQKNKIFQMFNSLKTKAEDTIDREQRNFNERIANLIETLKTEESTSNLFDKILHKDKDGKPDGSLIRKIKGDFYKDLESKNVGWIQSNTVFKPNAKLEFDKALQLYSNGKMQYAKTQKQIDQATKEIEEYNKKFNLWDAKYKNSAYNHYKNTKSSRYLTPNSSWYTSEYQYILNNPDKAISKIYNEFQKTIEESRQYTPDYISDSFIPSIQKGFFKKLTSAQGFKGLIDDAKDFYTSPPYEKINDEDVFKIPLKYTYDLKGEKSLDLGVVFSLFNHSVLQNKHLGEIENEVLLMENALIEAKYHDVDYRGNIQRDESGNVIKLDSDSKEGSNTISQFRSHMKRSLYGITDETKQIEFNGLSVNKMVDSAINYFSLSKLGLNIFTGVSNFIGGEAMLFSTAARTKHFDMKNVVNAQKLITTRNTDALSAIKFFDILSSDTTYKKSKKLSTDTVEKYFTLEKFYFMMEKGEWMIQNSALVAFLDANTIDADGKPKRKEEGDKSILELIGDNNGQINVQGLSEEGFDIIRKRMRGIAAEVMGSLSERDVLQAQQHLLGRAMLQFKRWMLPMGRARFGVMTYNENLDEFEEGKFRRFASDLVNRDMNGVKRNLMVAMASNIMDFTSGVIGKPNQSLITKVNEVYAKHVERFPEFADNVSPEEYLNSYIRNLRSTYFDFIAMGALVTLIAGLNGEDDENKNNFLNKALAKSLGELTFWVYSDSFIKLASQNVIPSISLVDNISDLAKESVKYSISFGDAGKPVEQVKKLVPLWKQFEYLEDGYNELIK